jgi:hypothetical protein
VCLKLSARETKVAPGDTGATLHDYELDRTQTAWRAARAETMREFGLGEGSILAVGHEAEVLALDESRVLRIYKPAADLAIIAGRRAFYDSLNRSTVPFSVTDVLEEHLNGGIVSVVERRIPGMSLDVALQTMQGSVRDYALLGFVDAASQIRLLASSLPRPGELLGAHQLKCDRWDDFLLQRAQRGLASHADRLDGMEGMTESARRALDHLGNLLSRTVEPTVALVHGDYHLGNVMVDGSGRITGVVDFGALTLAGDADLDLACTILNLTGVPAITREDRRLVSEHATRLGGSPETVELYSLYYAFRFLGEAREGLFRWCVEQISAAGRPS